MAAKKVISLTPQVVDLQLYAGDGVSLRVTLTDNQGLALPITGTVEAQVRAARADELPDTEFSADMSEATGGVVGLRLTGVQTSELLNGSDSFEGVWDVQWTATDEEPVTLVQGSVKCAQDVTR